MGEGWKTEISIKTLVNIRVKIQHIEYPHSETWFIQFMISTFLNAKLCMRLEICIFH